MTFGMQVSTGFIQHIAIKDLNGVADNFDRTPGFGLHQG
tara:strand:+ start:515 stop:631 length:117 start_codon:yes stop_codon:yes gene_type:complete